MWTNIAELEQDHSVLFRQCIELAKDRPEIIADLTNHYLWPVWEDSLKIQCAENPHAERLIYELTKRGIPEDTARETVMRFHRLAILDHIYFSSEPEFVAGWQRVLEGENFIDVQKSFSEKKLPVIYLRLHYRDVLRGLR